MDQIWQEIAQKDDAFFEKLPEASRDRITRDLFEAASRESSDEQSGRLSRFWPDLLLALTLIAFLVLGVRALTKSGSVAIALRDLRAGERLRAEMLHGAKRLALPDGQEPGPALRLIRSVPAGDYIVPADLERFEVVAASTIPQGAVIPAGAVRQEWKPYKRETVALLEQVVGSQTEREIKPGETILPDDLASESALVEQVVTSRRLPRLQRITAADLRLEKRPRQPGAVSKKEEAIGRYPLQEIDAGTTLADGRLSPGALTAEDLAGRQLLTVRVHPPSFRLLPQLPARVTLAATAPDERKAFCTDVIVLDVEPGGEGPALVVALTEAHLTELIPLLPEAQVFVLQPSR